MPVDLESIIIQQCQEKQTELLSERSNQDLINELSRFNKHLQDADSVNTSAGTFLLSMSSFPGTLPLPLSDSVVNSTNNSADFQSKKTAYAAAKTGIGGTISQLDTIINGTAFSQSDIDQAKAFKESIEESKIVEVADDLVEMEAELDALYDDCLTNPDQSAVEAAAAKQYEQQGQTPAAAAASAAADVAANFAAAQAAVGGAANIAATKASLKNAQILADESVSDSILYKEQCILLNHIVELVNEYKINPPLTLPPLPVIQPNDKHIKMLTANDPFFHIPALTQYPNQRYLFEIKNHELSSLQPQIRLFKTLINESIADPCEMTDKEEIEFEIPFESNSSKDNYFNIISNGKSSDPLNFFKTQSMRGFGVGIQSFTCKLNGSNPFAVKRSISATLKIKANNFSELSRERFIAPRSTEKFRYLDLALKTGGNAGARSEETNLLNYRLKAVVGWARPVRTDVPNFFSQGAHDALQESFMSLNLSPVRHSFELDDQGSVTFTIEYYSFIDQYFEQPNFDVLANPGTNKAKKSFEAAIDTEQKKKCAAVSSDAVEAINKSIDDLKKNFGTSTLSFKKNKLKSLHHSMMITGRLYYIPMTTIELLDALSEGPNYTLHSPSPSKANTASTQGSSKAIVETVNTSGGSSFGNTDRKVQKQINNISKENIIYFYVRDLFNTIFENMEIPDCPKQKVYYDKFRLLLGPLELYDYGSGKGGVGIGKTESVNIGYMPISLKKFTAWMTNKILSIDKTEYPLIAFCRDFFNEFLVNMLNDSSCFKYSTAQRTSLTQNFFTSYNEPDDFVAKDPITGLGLPPSGPGEFHYTTSVAPNTSLVPNQPLLSISGPKRDPRVKGKFINERYVLSFNAGRLIPNEKLTGDYETNMSSAIYHFLGGRPDGCIKNISLQRTNAAGLPEVRFEQEGYDGLRQLIDVYDVNITTFGNFNIFPGAYIYVDPKSFDPSSNNLMYNGKAFDLSVLGIGGYCMIIEVEHTIGPGQSETKLTARWVASTDTTNASLNKLGGPNAVGSCAPVTGN